MVDTKILVLNSYLVLRKRNCCRKLAKIAILPFMATCVVSYLDISGIRHTVEVEAESLYEAAALAVKAFRHHDCEPRGLAKLEVEIRTSIIHTLTIKRLEEWLAAGTRTPKDAILKDRLRQLVNSTDAKIGP